MSDNSDRSTPAWLTTSQAAALLGVSERTVQRRCKKGALVCRLDTTTAGEVWLVDAATLPTGADNVPTGDDTNRRQVPTGDDNVPTPAESESPEADDTGDKVTTRPADTADNLPTGDDNVPTGDDNVPTGDDNVPTRADTDLARVQGYLARDMELVIARATEAATTAAVAPLMAVIEAMAAQLEQQAHEAAEREERHAKELSAIRLLMEQQNQKPRPWWKLRRGDK